MGHLRDQHHLPKSVLTIYPKQDVCDIRTVFVYEDDRMTHGTFHSVLVTLAAYSNTFSICFIIICCLSMVIFIMRLSTDHFNASADVSPGSFVPAQAMTGVNNPFAVIVKDAAVASMKDGVTVHITSKVPFTLQDFWGVEIAKVYQQIFQPWSTFEEKFSHNMLFEDITLLKNEQILCQSMEYHVQYTPQGGTSGELDLGPVPRGRYPLVLVLAVSDSSNLPTNSIVSMVSIFHLKDEVVKVSSHVISQYVRSTSSQPVCLQQLFVASADEQEKEELKDESASQNVEEKVTGNCIICQTESISRVILPCRHACVCDDCFLRLDKCPMCRGPIISFFMLNGSTTSEVRNQETVATTGVPRQEHWWYRFNNSLNEFLGFTS